MAKVSLSALLDSLTGKLSGSVFQNSVGGLQLRSRVSPRDPKTTDQQIVRGNWGFLASSWNELSPSDIDSWNDNAPVGSNGKSFFQESNAKIASAGHASITTYTGSGPLATPGLNIDSMSFTDMIISFPTLVPVVTTDYVICVFATPCLSAGTSFISPSTYRLIGTYPVPTAMPLPYNAFPGFTARYGAPVAGSVVGFRAYLVNFVTGASSPDSLVQGYVS